MLIRFSAQNFLSIREKQELNFIPSNTKELLATNVVETGFDGLSLLRSIGIFGSNSSGKSNLFKSLHFVKTFVIESSVGKQSHYEIQVRPFLLHQDYRLQPSCFEIEFLIEDLIYTYKLKVTRKSVVEESLFYRKKKKDFLLFQRTENTYSLGNKFKTVENITTMTRPNASFLSVLAQFNFPLAVKVIEWFSKLRFLRDEFSPYLIQKTAEFYKSGKYKLIIERILKNADLGFKKITTSSEPVDVDLVKDMLFNPMQKGNSGLSAMVSRLNIKSIHNVYDSSGNVIGEEELDISVESLGTQKYISMVGRIAQVLTEGGVLLIDEIDARLHPFLSESIIHYFNSELNNPNNAQLVFISHNSHLMKNHLLRRDQIYVIEKDSFESTRLGTFMDQKIRYDVNYEKVYLERKAKGTPNINSQLVLFTPDR